MAFRRRLGNLAGTLLEQRLRDKSAEKQSELVQQRQLELADLNHEFAMQQSQEAQKQTRLRQYGENPTLASTAAQSGDKDAEPFIQRNREILAPAFESIAKAKNAEDMPSLEALFGARKSGIIDNLSPITELDNARTAQLSRIADTTSEEVDKAGATSFNSAYGQAMGNEAATATNAPAALAREVTKENTLNPIKFIQEQKLANMRAAVDLRKQKDFLTHELITKRDFEAAKATNAMATEASKLVLQMTELTTLAADINASYSEGGVDTYAGLRNAVGSLPYLGNAMSGGMATASASVQSMMSGDKTLPRKVNNLEGMRRAAAIAAIRAAGDPRPSDADVSGVIGSLPGAFESLEATVAKSNRFRDSVVMLPEIMAAHPGVAGKALLDLALAEAQKRSQARASASPSGTPTEQRGQPAPPPSVQSILSR